jgi:hypothetical protein
VPRNKTAQNSGNYQQGYHNPERTPFHLVKEPFLDHLSELIIHKNKDQKARNEPSHLESKICRNSSQNASQNCANCLACCIAHPLKGRENQKAKQNHKKARKESSEPWKNSFSAQSYNRTQHYEYGSDDYRLICKCAGERTAVKDGTPSVVSQNYFELTRVGRVVS